jgi:hypothetical protein
VIPTRACLISIGMVASSVLYVRRWYRDTRPRRPSRYRPEADKSTFYITKSQIGKLLWIDERDERDKFDSMLTGMMNVNLE